MRKNIFAVICIMILFQQICLYAEENKPGFRGHFDWSLKFLFPVDEVGTFTFVDFGFGISYDIIPRVLSPGIYIDAGVGPGWIALFDDNNSYKIDSARDLWAFGVILGARLYNITKINDFSIIPFVGYNFLFFIIPLPNVGIQLVYKNFSIEYAYYFPDNHARLTSHGTLHHISIKMMGSAFSFRR